MARTLRVIGLIWCYAVAALIALSFAMILWKEGYWKLAEVMSPFNIANFVVTILALAPGLAMLWAADRLKQRGN